jgi:hypothetical protein
MITDRQVKRLWKALTSGKTLAQAADNVLVRRSSGIFWVDCA